MKLYAVQKLLLERTDLTHQTAIDQGLGWRLSDIIYRLRKKHGWPIETHTDHLGIAHYWLPRGWKPQKEKAQ